MQMQQMSPNPNPNPKPNSETNPNPNPNPNPETNPHSNPHLNMLDLNKKIILQQEDYIMKTRLFYDNEMRLRRWDDFTTELYFIGRVN